jgi:hypothetical protein
MNTFVSLYLIRIDKKVLLGSTESNETETTVIIEEKILRNVYLRIVAFDRDAKELIAGELVITQVNRMRVVLPVVFDRESRDTRK